MAERPWNLLVKRPGETALSFCERTIKAMTIWHREWAAELLSISSECRLIEVEQGPDAAKSFYHTEMDRLYAITTESTIAMQEAA